MWVPRSQGEGVGHVLAEVPQLVGGSLGAVGPWLGSRSTAREECGHPAGAEVRAVAQHLAHVERVLHRGQAGMCCLQQRPPQTNIATAEASLDGEGVCVGPDDLGRRHIDLHRCGGLAPVRPASAIGDAHGYLVPRAVLQLCIPGEAQVEEEPHEQLAVSLAAGAGLRLAPCRLQACVGALHPLRPGHASRSPGCLCWLAGWSGAVPRAHLEACCKGMAKTPR
mmetsp:Transcript_61807/g.132900  ORF Transcript_61807/g.132900 Transcript_61807/m.132900 type:complete len:223 (+) Transcript_61807:552-1220(+)